MPLDAAAIPLPTQPTPQALYLWAVTLVARLRQKGVLDDNDISAISDSVNEQAAAIAAVEATATTTASQVVTLNSQLATAQTQLDTNTAGLESLNALIEGGVISGAMTEQQRFELSLMTATDAVLGSAGDIARQAMIEAETAGEAALRARIEAATNGTGIRVLQETMQTDSAALARQLETVNANVAMTQGFIATEAVARVNGDNATASLVTTVETTVAGHTAYISTLLDSVDGINARWGVVINLQGQVTGLVQLDGSDSGSTFTVVADKFIVANPGTPADTAAPFVVGLVNGVSTVGVNGYLVVDGTIIARHIAAGQIDAAKIAAASIDASRLNVSSLSAIAANLGEVTAGLIRNPADTLRFDLPAMRLYRVDGKMDVDLGNIRIYMETSA